jgi:membrane-associated phospholipid phosphatase
MNMGSITITQNGITMRRTLLLSILLLFCESSLFAQNKYNFSQFGNETWSFVKQPTIWDGNDWLKIGVISAGTFMVMETADQPIRTAVLKDQRYYKSVPIEFGRMWGELYAPVVLFGGFALHSWLADDIGTRKIAYEIGQASLYAGAINYLLKVAFGRARPYMEEGKNSFHPFSTLFNTDHQAFPSGHSTVALILSTVLSRNAKPVWLKGLAYLPAALTIVSRVYQDQHWASDAFLGAGFGYFIASWVVDLHENSKSKVELSSVYPLSIRIVL